MRVARIFCENGRVRMEEMVETIILTDDEVDHSESDCHTTVSGQASPVRTRSMSRQISPASSRSRSRQASPIPSPPSIDKRARKRTQSEGPRDRDDMQNDSQRKRAKTREADPASIKSSSSADQRAARNERAAARARQLQLQQEAEEDVESVQLQQLQQQLRQPARPAVRAHLTEHERILAEHRIMERLLACNAAQQLLIALAKRCVEKMESHPYPLPPHEEQSLVDAMVKRTVQALSLE